MQDNNMSQIYKLIKYTSWKTSRKYLSPNNKLQPCDFIISLAHVISFIPFIIPTP